MPRKNLGYQAGSFLRHVLPAALKPVHSLWHEVLGFFFVAVAGWGFWRVLRSPGTLPPIEFALVIVFLVVLFVYGVSSFLKARRISRS